MSESKILDAQPSLIEIAIEPKSKADQDKLSVALAALTAEDALLRASTDQESGQIILKGVSEEHLDIKVDMLKRVHKVEINIGAPQVAYRETITRRATRDYTYKKVIGPKGQFARVKIVLDPLPVGGGFVFANEAADGNVPMEFIPGVEKGLASVLASGVLAGFPVVDLKVTLIDGANHDVDSSQNAFEIATRAALREGLRKAAPVLIEPVMKVEVMTPEDFTAPIIADLKTRRGRMQGQIMRNAQVAYATITALVPLSCMFGYVSNLRSMSEGRATFTMWFDHYAVVPRAIDDDPTFPPAIGMRA